MPQNYYNIVRMIFYCQNIRKTESRYDVNIKIIKGLWRNNAISILFVGVEINSDPLNNAV